MVLVDETLPDAQLAMATHRFERLAWLVMWLAFASFGVVCVGSTLGIYFFLFQSNVALATTVEVGRGTVGITDAELIPRRVRDADDLTGTAAIVDTDEQSQATISFNLPASSRNGERGPLVAMVTLRGNTSAHLRQAVAPRFDWSNTRYEIELRDFAGEMDVFITPIEADVERELLIRVYNRQGSLVHLSNTGRYYLEARAQRARVTNQSGQAVLFGSELRNNRAIPQGEQAVFFPERTEIVVSPSRANLLQNSLLRPAPQSAFQVPADWGCTNLQDAPPRGDFRLETYQGLTALRMVRAENASSHGETVCRQPFPEPGYALGDRNYLELRATFAIDFQSLSKCGTAASECPMMFRLEYFNANAEEEQYGEIVQGFYAADNPTIQYPSRCPTCPQDHSRINEKVWYTHATGNLYDLLPPGTTHITNFEFYASGHQYDVFVHEVNLFVGYSDVLPPELLDLAPEATPTLSDEAP